MRAKHTPGPWKLTFGVAYTSGHDPEPDYEFARIKTDGAWNIAIIYSDNDEWVDNARLIAAAPLLYDALTRMRDEGLVAFPPYVREALAAVEEE